MAKKSPGGLTMDEKDFEGSSILEQLAAIGLMDQFYEAVDSDNIERVISLLREAGIEESQISMVVKKIINGED